MEHAQRNNTNYEQSPERTTTTRSRQRATGDKPTRVRSLPQRVFHILLANKFNLLLSLCSVVLLALLTSLIFGTPKYDFSRQRGRGLAREKRQSVGGGSSGGDAAGENDYSTGGGGGKNFKDPYANRPRIQTRNGHLIIEASLNKNIDFKTSGARGTVTINGHKLDSLINVTRALEQTMGLAGGAGGNTGIGTGTGTGKTAGVSTSSGAQVGKQQQLLVGAAVRQQGSTMNEFMQVKGNSFEETLRNLLSAGERYLILLKQFDRMGDLLGELTDSLSKLARQVAKVSSDMGKMKKKQWRLVKKLRRNDCFDMETGKPVCKNGATCLDAFDSFQCLCPATFEGQTCEEDVNECAKFSGTDLGCQNGAKCINLVGGYKCECPARFHGVHCTELHDDCSLGSSRSLCGYGKCFNLPRTEPNQARYQCICDQGWTSDGVNPACVIDINECLVGQSALQVGGVAAEAGKSPAAATSNNSLTGISMPWSQSLMAAYPCSQNPYVECINLPGSFQCAPCPPGYTGNGRLCRDINECLANNGGCSTNPLVECINTQGSRRCGLCPAGYTGDGVTCTPMGVCASSMQVNGGCHPMAKCVDLPSVSLQSRLCICQYPYSGEGVGPNGCVMLGGGAATTGNGTAATPTSGAAGSSQQQQQQSAVAMAEKKYEQASYQQKQQQQSSLGDDGGATKRLPSVDQLIVTSSSSAADSTVEDLEQKRQQVCARITCLNGGKCQLKTGSGKQQTQQQQAFNNDNNNKTPTQQQQQVTDEFECACAPGYTGKYCAQHECGGRLQQASGLVSSPKFPDKYPFNLECVWILEAPGGRQQLRLNFTSFKLEFQKRCLFDYLEIRNGPNSDSPLVGRFCNQDLANKVILSHTSSLRLYFRSDQSLTGPGFQLQYDAYQSGCGGKLTGPSGQVDSPNYPQAYGHSSDCEWIIEVAEANRIELTVVDLDLSSGLVQSTGTGTGAMSGVSAANRDTDCFTNGSRLDYLEVFDSGPEFLSNKLFLVYKSQALDNSRGFRLTYRTICDSIELVGYRGIIESPGFPASYARKLNCTWLIRAPLGSNLSLAITDLDLEDTPISGGAAAPWRIKTTATPSTRQLLEATNKNNKKQSRLRYCSEDFLEIYSIYPPFNATPTSFFATPKNISDLIQFGSAAAASTSASGAAGSLINAARNYDPKVMSTRGRLSIKNGRLIRTLCGKLEELDEGDSGGDKFIQLDTNVAYLHFESDESVELGGFRLEWQSTGCGGHQMAPVGGASEHDSSSAWFRNLKVISYHERTILNNQQPYECLWTYDLSKTAQTLEFHLHSNMRQPGADSKISTSAAVTGTYDACADASLTIYDGLTDKAPVLSRNCDRERDRETVFTTGGQALVRFYSSGKHQYGRGFVLSGWPSAREECIPSLFDIDTPFNTVQGYQNSPNYPDLYGPQKYACFGMLHADSGRFRFQLEELDIPAAAAASSSGEISLSLSSEDQQQQSAAAGGGLLTKQECKASGNYLLIRSLNSRQVEEVFCGKFDKQLANAADVAPSQTKRSEVILEQESAWLEFHSRDRNRGRWRLSYSRLCGSVLEISSLRDVATPNYPARPQWRTTERDGGVAGDALSMDGVGGLSENVCIWRIKAYTGDRWLAKSIQATSSSRSKTDPATPPPKKLHLNVLNFKESPKEQRRPTDCLRVYEGVSIGLRQASYNLTELDNSATAAPKLKLCRDSDLSQSNLFYVSEGSEITLVTSGEVAAKVRIRLFENFCGGEFYHQRAEFATPQFPQPYPNDLDCQYFIVGSPGARIQLKFLSFDLPDGSPTQVSQAGNNNTMNCDNTDYVEIRQLTRRQKLSSRWNVLLNSVYTISNWFDSAYLIGTTGGYDMQSTTNSSNNKKQQSQQVKTSQSSNKWPPTSQLFERAKWFYLFSDFDNPTSYSVSSANWYLNPLTRNNEFYENSRLLGRFCGNKPPPSSLLQSTNLRDEIMIRFRSHSNQVGGGVDSDSDSGKGTGTAGTSAGSGQAPRGFLASYSFEYGGLIQLLDEQSMETGGFIGSPQFPVRMRWNNTIRWFFESKLDSVLQFELIQLDLGSIQQDCSDSLSVFDGLTSYEGAIRLSVMCGHLSFKSLSSLRMSDYFASKSLSKPKLSGNSSASVLNLSWLPNYLAHDPKVRANLMRPIRTSSNVATLVYENYKSESLFLIKYKAIPTSALANEISRDPQVGVEPADTPLEETEALQQQESEGMMSNGGAVIGLNNNQTASKSCSHTWLLSLDPSPNSATNSNVNNTFNSTKTGATQQVNDDDAQVVLASPNWPNEPQGDWDIECDWLVFTQDNTNIRLAIDPPSLVAPQPAGVGAAGGVASGAELEDSFFGGGSESSSSTNSADHETCFARGVTTTLNGGAGGAEKRARNFIVVHDGATKLAPVIKRLCLPAPPLEFQSSGRHLLIRYVHIPAEDKAITQTLVAKSKTTTTGDSTSKRPPPNEQQVASLAGSGTSGLFRARASVGQCGGQFHIISTARIRDRPKRSKSGKASGEMYSNNLDCRYYLFAANSDKVIIIHNSMSSFNLSPEPTNADCSVGDYIEVRDLPVQQTSVDSTDSSSSSMSSAGTLGPNTRLSGRLLGRYCAGHKLEYLESPGSAISIEFHTDQQNVGKGFELYVMSSAPHLNCPRGHQALNVHEPFGLVTSPNWPHGFYGMRQCKYQLVAPLNQSIQLTFVRLKRPILSRSSSATPIKSGSVGVASGDTPTTSAKVQCADSLNFLADNEARSIQFNFPRSLKQLDSTISGTLMRPLVLQVPCWDHLPASATGDFPLSEPYAELLDIFDSLGGGGDSSSSAGGAATTKGTAAKPSATAESFRKISAEDYFRLARIVPAKSFTIQSESSVLLLDYLAKNLLPDEGFLAIYRLVDEQKYKCGGELRYKSSSSSSGSESKSTTTTGGATSSGRVANIFEMLDVLDDTMDASYMPKKSFPSNSGAQQSSSAAARSTVAGTNALSSNIIESANFNEMTISDNNLLDSTGTASSYIQCEWSVTPQFHNLEYSSAGISFNMEPNQNLVEFPLAYLIFQVLEIPATGEKSLMSGNTDNTNNNLMTLDESLEISESETRKRAQQVCGLNRLLIADSYFMHTSFACGNLTDQQRFFILEPHMRRITLRTKNLPRSPLNSKAATGTSAVNAPSPGNTAQVTSGTGTGRETTNNQQQQQQQLFYRGLRAFYYEKNCLQMERTIGDEGIRIRSHRSFPNASYTPGICRWELRLSGGDYELWFDRIQFRRPEKAVQQEKQNNNKKDNASSNNNNACDSKGEPDLDYLEIRASSEPDSPVLARYCYYNQAQVREKSLLVNMRAHLTILFVAGWKQLSQGIEEFSPATQQLTTTSGEQQQSQTTTNNLNSAADSGNSGNNSGGQSATAAGNQLDQASADKTNNKNKLAAAAEQLERKQSLSLGFDMQLIRVKNESMSEFCRHDSRFNFHWFIHWSERESYTRSYFSMLGASNALSGFLYPKNTDCSTELSAEQGARFNFTFRGNFDFESSLDCQNDYIQIDDLLPAQTVGTANKPLTTSASSSPGQQQVKVGQPAPVPAAAPMTIAQKLKSFQRNKQQQQQQQQQQQLASQATTSQPPPPPTGGAFTQFHQVIDLKSVAPEWRTRRVGRWCGRSRPLGWFSSTSNRVRISFHSNDRIEGKGFQLEYSIIPPAAQVTTNSNSSPNSVPLKRNK